MEINISVFVICFAAVSNLTRSLVASTRFFSMSLLRKSDLTVSYAKAGAFQHNLVTFAQCKLLHSAGFEDNQENQDIKKASS